MPKENIERAIAKRPERGRRGEFRDRRLRGTAGRRRRSRRGRHRPPESHRVRVRHAFTKHGGNLGTKGAVAWQFERRGVVLVPAEGTDEDALVLVQPKRAPTISLTGRVRGTSPPEVLSAVRQAFETPLRGRVGRARDGAEPRSPSRRVDRAPDHNLVEGLEDTEDVTGRLRELVSPSRSGIVASLNELCRSFGGHCGRRADRIERSVGAALRRASARRRSPLLRLEPLRTLSLYAMDDSGGVPEPLLPPQVALQNPELVGGHLFTCFPGFARSS